MTSIIVPITELIAKFHGSLFVPELDRLPAPTATVSIGGLIVPLYFQIIGIEAQLIEERQVLLDDLGRKIDEMLVVFDKAIPSKAPKQVRIKNLLDAYATGSYRSSVHQEVPFDLKLAGVSEAIDLATKFGVSQFKSYYPVKDGEVSKDLVNLVNKYDDIWIDNLVDGDTTLDRLNAVLAQKPFIKLGKVVSQTVTVNEDVLSLDDVRTYQALTDKYYYLRMFKYTRTGNANEFFDYSPVNEISAYLTAIYNELKPDPEVSKNIEAEYLKSNSKVEDSPAPFAAKEPIATPQLQQQEISS